MLALRRAARPRRQSQHCEAFEAASNDPEYIKETTDRNGVPFSYIGVARGEATFRSLAEVSPEVLKTLRAGMGGAN